MADLVQWLTAQLDEDERIARAAIRAVGDVPGGVPGAADWRFGNAFTDEGGTYWQITTMPPDADVFGVIELIGSGMSGGGAHEPEIARHAVEHDPARVLREVEMKRQVVEQHRPVGYGGVCLSLCHTRAPGQPQTWPCLTLRLLASVYEDRPGYQESWRP